MNSQPRHIEIYDTTLRDGTQGQGVSFSLDDKLKITCELDRLGVDFIEGGYPLSNPKDVGYFKEAQTLDLQHAKVCAFGMTRRRGVTADADDGMKALVEAGSPIVTIVGKTWDLHVDEVLRVDRDENLAMIRDSVAFCREEGREVFYDAEHFFDGFDANRDYALQTLRAALDGGATRLVLCDTNGGSWLGRIEQFVQAVHDELNLEKLGVGIGIHTHNDGGLATANSIVAVRAGAVQVQGTVNGIGERCGNVDLITVAAHILLKSSGAWTCLQGESSLKKLTDVSRFVYELANMIPPSNQPYVGSAAFAHKGGMHVHAVNRLARSYEHIEPESVGNLRQVLVSDVSGASNILARLGDKFDNVAEDKSLQRRLLDRVKTLENEGYMFESTGASLELLLRRELDQRRNYWTLDHYRCVILRLNGDAPTTEAIVKVAVADTLEHEVAEGDGPVNALDAALRKCLRPHYPVIDRVRLTDYKVRVVNASDQTAAKVRVIIDFAVDNDAGHQEATFSTIGVNENIVDASWEALIDAFEYHLLELDTPVVGSSG